jgi:hypothetical protein
VSSDRIRNVSINERIAFMSSMQKYIKPDQASDKHSIFGRGVELTAPVAQHDSNNLAGSAHAVRVPGAFAVRIGKGSQCHLTSQNNCEAEDNTSSQKNT